MAKNLIQKQFMVDKAEWDKLIKVCETMTKQNDIKYTPSAMIRLLIARFLRTMDASETETGTKSNDTTKTRKK